MLDQHLDLTIALAWTIVIANIIVVPIVLRFAPLIARVTVIPPNVLLPLVLALIVIAVFQVSSSIGDVVVFGGAAVLGLFMKAYGWPRPPIVIAIVLGEIVEKFLWLSVSTYGWSMFQRPQFVAILVVVLAAAVFGMRIQAGAQKVSAMAEAEELASNQASATSDEATGPSAPQQETAS